MKATSSWVLTLSLLASGWPVRAHAGPGPIESTIAREAAQLAASQPKDSGEANWARVSALAPGTTILLTTRGARPVSHRLVGADDTGITVANGTSPEKISRLDVVEVRVPGERRGSWIAGAVAAGLSFALVGLPLAIGYAQEPCEPNCGSERAGVVISTIGIPVGAGYTAYKLFGRRTQQIIYRAP